MSKELARHSENDRKKALEVLRKGYWPSRFLLSACGAVNPVFELALVDYRNRALLPHAYLVRNAQGPRLRLKSPFREQFGQWVGSCISRVGPENATLIPQFTEKLYPAHILNAVQD